MKIHSNTLTMTDVREAAAAAGVTFDRCTESGSRSKARAFDVTLRGNSRRAPNFGTGKVDRFGVTEKAATWDQWGVFLGVLFARDDEMVTPYDKSGDAFHERTAHRFFQAGIFPADAHGDHRFTFQGIAREQGCTKCSATQRWAS